MTLSLGQRAVRFLLLLAICMSLSLGSGHLPGVFATEVEGAELFARGIPRPLPHHPGNIFLEGESIQIELPKSGQWTLLDAEDRVIKQIEVSDKNVELGPLPVGFYRLKAEGYGDWISLGVIAPLRVPTPESSPIALDVAMSWFYPEKRMPEVANLCALAGVNWVRDRLSWAEVEPEPGKFVERTRYDAAAEAQHSAGLKVLQVFHASPKWANPETKRFPLDLRDCYRFLNALAQRWQGKVLAWEPWNEADIDVFGGHTGAEMASLQKAAYWAIKSADKDTIVCWNVFAVNKAAYLEDISANDILPYCDTFNFHHYIPFEAYPAWYQSFREVAGGLPLWVSECAMPLRWAGDPQRQELSDADLVEQARRLVKVFAGSLHEGAAATFYFLLPHYVEGPTQFGIIRRDLTPRPAYISLAAVGRLLADARPLGKLAHDQALVYAFLARPDGEEKVVLVAWSQSPVSLQLPEVPAALYDFLGRRVETVTESVALGPSPVFILADANWGTKLTLVPPPQAPKHDIPGPCPVVFQSLWKSDLIDLQNSAYRVSPDQPIEIPVFVYNFGESTLSGPVELQAPAGWSADLPKRCEVPSGARLEWLLKLTPPQGWQATPATIRLTGDFGQAGKSLLSIRLVPRQ